MTNLVLTQAELEMIQTKREQLAAQEAELLAKNLERLQKEVDGKTQVIKKKLAINKDQVAATEAFAKELGKEYKVEYREQSESFFVYDYTTTPKTIFWSEEIVNRTAFIRRGAHYINVEEHMTYSSKWDSRGTSKGWKMYIGGPEVESTNRPYARISKVKEVIDSANKTIAYKEKLVEDKKNAVATTMAQMKAQYPGAEITSSKEWPIRYNKYSSNDPYETVTIKFENGVVIKYKVYPDASLEQLSLRMPNTSNNYWDIMEKVSKINF